MNQKYGKVVYIGFGVSIFDLYEYKGQFERFGMNISRDDEICGLEFVVSFCYIFVVDIKSIIIFVCDVGQVFFMVYGNFCNSKLEFCVGCGDWVVFDVVNQCYGEVVNMVLNIFDLINVVQGLEIYDRNGYLRQFDEVNICVLFLVGEEFSVG